jgi:transposase-like protein
VTDQATVPKARVAPPIREIPEPRRLALEQKKKEQQALRRSVRRRLRRPGGNVAQTARELGLSRDVVSRIRDDAGIPVKVGTGESVRGARVEERAAVYAWLMETGGNVKRTARETGVPETTIRRWRANLVSLESSEGSDT